jgi:hypothetical protein
MRPRSTGSDAFPARGWHDGRLVQRLLRRVLAAALLTVAVGVVLGRLALDLDGPYLEALPAYPYCDEAADALADDRVLDALELAEAGACGAELATARSRWSSLTATFERCLEGVWTGYGDDATAVGCAVASDLVVFGDVRDLTRQGLAWGRGETTDPVLVALSTAGLVLTFAPQVGLGNAVMKVARRAGTLTSSLAGGVVTLVRRGAWAPLATMLGDAGRIGAKVGVARGTRALAYADDAAEVATLARYVERVPHPLLGLRWAGKGAVRLADDDALYRAALSRGPDGVRLAAERGGRALLTRRPLLVAMAKGVWKNPEALARALAAIAAWLLRWATWSWVMVVSATLALAATIVWPRRRRRTKVAARRSR